VVWVDRVVTVLHDVMDSVFVSLVFVLLQVVCVQSVVQEPYGGVFVLVWGVGGVGGIIVSVKWVFCIWMSSNRWGFF
jgi:hypothetical protein